MDKNVKYDKGQAQLCDKSAGLTADSIHRRDRSWEIIL